MYEVEHGFKFVLRSIFRASPFRFAIYALLLGMVAFGFALRIMESPTSRISNEMNNWMYVNCLYEIMITMTTGKKSVFRLKFTL
jgi:hypothetical protein